MKRKYLVDEDFYLAAVEEIFGSEKAFQEDDSWPSDSAVELPPNAIPLTREQVASALVGVFAGEKGMQEILDELFGSKG